MQSSKQLLYNNLPISGKLRSLFSSSDSPLSHFLTKKTCADNGSTRIQTKTSLQKASMFHLFVTVLSIAEFHYWIYGRSPDLCIHANSRLLKISQWHYESCSAITVAGLYRIFTCFPFNHSPLKLIWWTNHNHTLFNYFFIIHLL